MFFFHTYIFEKYFKMKNSQYNIFPASTFIDTMPICGDTDILGHNDRCEVNRSGSTHYDICMRILYA